MSDLFCPTKREFKVKTEPQQKFETGAVFVYTGSSARLKGFLLIHKVDPQYSQLKKFNGSPLVADDHVVAEVLVPSNGYCDYCLFWVNKKDLRVPRSEEYHEILKALN